MFRSLSRAVIGLVCLVLFAMTSCATAPAEAASSTSVRYHLSIPAPERQYVHVRLHVGAPSGTEGQLVMPAWAPGSYRIRDFARHVYDFAAVRSDGTTLPVRRVDKQTWEVEHGGHDFEVHYRVFADEETVRTSHVGDGLATLNGSSVFVYLEGARERRLELEVEAPPGWAIHTGLEPRGGSDRSFVARDYDELADSPLLLGNPQVRVFEVEGTRFEYVLAGGESVAADVERLVHDTQAVVTALGRAMGGFPMQRYVFMLVVNAEGGGGLEHDDSTLMMVRRSAFAEPDVYLKIARLTAHEFFHLWNVRRIRDAALRPYDYRRENHTSLLWFHEGFTEAIEAQAALWSGLVDEEKFLKDLAEEWTAYVRKPGRNYAPIDQLSFEAWVKAYQPAPNHRNTAISYYEKGAFLGLSLDLELRTRSARHGRQGSLVGLFRRLMKSHGAPELGITYDDIVAAASEEAGEDMAWFFDRYVRGTEEVPLPQLLPAVGIAVEAVPPWQPEKGGTPLSGLAEARARTYVGINLQGNRVDSVDPSSPAEAAGLMIGDEIIAVAHRRTHDTSDVLHGLARVGPGGEAAVHVFRDGGLRALTVRPIENPYPTYRFKRVPVEELEAGQQALRSEWLGQRDLE